MEEKLDFENVGRKMPYKLPEGFFDDAQQKILNRITADSINRRTRRRVFYASLLAAVLLVTFILSVTNSIFIPATNGQAVPTEVAYVDEIWTLDTCEQIRAEEAMQSLSTNELSDMIWYADNMLFYY